MDTRSKNRLTKIIEARGGQTDDDWEARCTLLVVKDARTTRTPKLLQAVGNGRDVVTPAFFDAAGKAGDHTTASCCPAVAMDAGKNITPAQLRATILKYRADGPALRQRAFFTGDIKEKGTRDQVGEIISGCGGTVARRRTAKTADVADKDLDGFYTAILSGLKWSS
jgi:hypothetical protein